MDGIIEIEGEELHRLLAEIKNEGRVLRLRIHTAGGTAKFKVNEGRWTPWLGTPSEGPTPRCSECGWDRGEHRAETYHCPVFVDGNGDVLSGFQQTRTYVPLARA